MKLKYKKMILLTTMSTMGIGLLTIFINHDSTKAEESLNAINKSEASVFAEDTDTPTLMADQEENSTLITPTPSLSPTPSPTPTPLPVYDLEEDTNKDVVSLFEDYYAAKNNCDVKKLKSMFTNPDKVATEEQLQSKTEYIDDYRNIKTYAKKGTEEGTYIVYAYHEIKITGVNTAAPGLAKFYLVTDDDGELKIFNGQMDEELEEYYNDRENDEDVQELIKKINKKGEEAKSKDEDLKEFWEKIDEMANQNLKKAETKNDNEAETSKE